MRQVFDLDVTVIRKMLDKADWEPCPDDDAYQTRRVWLGTVFGLLPSGKFYLPFACSNVDPCPACEGSGVAPAPRTGRRARRRALRRAHDFSRGTLARRRSGTDASVEAYVARVRRFRYKAFEVTSVTCPLCAGVGSLEAHKDQLWTEQGEEALRKIGASLDWEEEGCVAAETRETPDAEEEETDAVA